MLRPCHPSILVFASSFALATLAVSAHPAMSGSRRSEQPGNPLALPFDPDAYLGGLHHKIRDFANGIPWGRAARVRTFQRDGTACRLTITPAPASGKLAKQWDANAQNGYVVARIGNPDGCDVPDVPLKKGEEAVWIAKFTKGPLTGQREDLGISRLVRLSKHFYQGDDRLSSVFWTLGQCDHSSGNTGDNALILTRGTVCTVTTRQDIQHDMSKVAAYLETLANRKPGRRTSEDDSAFWFLCGGDCCYTDSLL